MNLHDRIYLYMSIQLLIHVLSVSLSSHWDIEHIVFGEDVILTCIINVCSNSVKSWVGGQSYDLLCRSNFSTNPSKYEMISEDSGRSFGLRIKNFTFDDVNCKYTCTCGLHQYTSILDVEAINYTYPPRIIENSNFQTAEEYVVDVVIEVYPLPTCFIKYEGRDIQVNLTSNSSTLSTFDKRRFGSNKMYKGRIKHTLQIIKPNNCDGNLLVTCEVDSRNYTVYKQNVSMCKDHSDINVTTINEQYVTVFVIIIACALFLLGVVLLWKRVKQRKPCEMSCLDNTSNLKCIWKKQPENNNEPQTVVDEPLIQL
ncbi:unnamed protein product [Mytilus coruscus]|uniref:Ig-like domain-containing protein n=1 Tax=Mytilus coruscus TaxID=42192 RepID=A0A6J8EUE4_MYTCO|nr:unnamed protein product [Mytilus coruscus]